MYFKIFVNWKSLLKQLLFCFCNKIVILYFLARQVSQARHMEMVLVSLNFLLINIFWMVL